MMMSTDAHSCQAAEGSSCSSCRGCHGRRAAHDVRLSSGQTMRVVRCSHCDGPDAHAVAATSGRPPVRLCEGRVSGFSSHPRHVIGAAAA